MFRSVPDYKLLYPEWDNSANFCGPNRYILGDIGDDFDAWNNIQIYHSLVDECYVLDQPFATTDLNVLLSQLEIIVTKLRSFIDENNVTIEERE
jgi:hypothetical protein